MKPYRILLPLALLAPLGALVIARGSAKAQTGMQHPAIAKIKERYNAISKLTVKNDGATLAVTFKRIITPDFKYIDAKKNEYSGEFFAAQLAGAARRIKQCISCTNKVIGARGSENKLVVTVASAYDMTLRNNGGRLKGESVSYDTWVKVGDDWKMKRSQTFKEKATLNGKAVD